MKRAALGLMFVLACSSPGGPIDGGTGGGGGSGGGGGGTSDSGTGGGDAGSAVVPLNHRPTGEMCSHTRPAGIPVVGAPGCASDAECDAGVNGRCSVNNGGAQFNVCTYDECFSDADCSGGAPCSCRSVSGANTCLTQSGCRVDSDCGDGGYCSLSPASTFSCTPSYQCHTPNDTCLGACPADGGSPVCAYDPGSLSWSCTFFCAVP